MTRGVNVYCLDCDIPEKEHGKADHPFRPCLTCKSGGGPPHWASQKCESGGYPHCSCSICF